MFSTSDLGLGYDRSIFETLLVPPAVFSKNIGTRDSHLVPHDGTGLAIEC